MLNFRSLSITALLLTSSLIAQDTLVYRNGQHIIGQVEEVGTERVRYRTNSGTSSVVVEVDRIELSRVRLQNGQAFLFDTSVGTQNSAEFRARKNVLSLDVLAPALDHATIGYERVIGKQTSLRVRVGYIGLWRSERPDERVLTRGWLVRIGPKFELPSGSKRYPAARDTHPLAGWYLSPELLFSYHADPSSYYTYPNYYWESGAYETRYTFRSSAALNLTLGRQVFLSERFTFDIHGGMGYGIRWTNGVSLDLNDRSSNGDDSYRYTHTFFGSSSPLCVSGGVSFGYAFR